MRDTAARIIASPVSRSGQALVADAVVARPGHNGRDAVLSSAGKAGSVTPADAFYGGDYGVDPVRFASGVVWSKAEPLNARIA